MRNLILLVALLCCSVTLGTIEAQAIVGLPQHGITLSGPIDRPVIHNASGRDLMAYVLHFRDAHGIGPFYPELGTAHIRRADPIITEIPFERFTPKAGMPNHPQSAHSPFVGVTLDAVVFADGEYLPGVHETWEAFHIFTIEVEAEKAMGQLLAATRNNPAQQAAAWARINAWAEVPTDAETTGMDEGFRRGQQHIVARDLITAKRNHGDAAAFDMADRMAKLASIWRAK